jgi:hypothetical protein
LPVCQTAAFAAGNRARHCDGEEAVRSLASVPCLTFCGAGLRSALAAARIKKAGAVPSFGPSRVRIDPWSMPPELPNEECRRRGTRMKKTIAGVFLSLALMSSAAMANDRAGNPVSGALSKIGHAAHTLVGHLAKPFTARSRRSSATRQAQSATVAGPSSHVSDSPPAPRSQTDAPTVAPSTPRSASTLPPVQPLE